jgi:hypothetical protein
MRIETTLYMESLNSTIKYFFLFTLLVMFSFTANAQSVIFSAGDWGTPSIWTFGNIADDITEDVIIMNNRGTITVSNDYTIGNIALNDKNTLTINANHSLSIGESGTPKDFITNNTAELNVDGDLTIWGDLTVNNNLDLNVSGNLIIKGSADLNNTAEVNVSGTMTIDGNFTANNNLDFVVDGMVTIDGDFTTGNGATTSGSGAAIIGGTCSSSICNTGPLAAVLPIELYSYEVKLEDNNVRIDWATASEIDNDYFVVERSTDAYHFEEIGREEGAGFSESFRYYAITDKFPFEGVSYYRLKQVDFDGTATYFDIKMVDNNDGYTDEHGRTVYPNPIMEHSKFNIGLEGFEGNTVQVKIQNMSGFLIYSNEVNISQERELIELETNIIQDSGMYVVSVFNNSKWYHHKFMFVK